MLINYLQLIRFEKPIGTLLLFFPCLFGLVLSSKIDNTNLFDFTGFYSTGLYFTGLFLIGSFLMRSSGCIINDLLDRNLDKNVARTANRAIASQKISVKNALIFLAILLFISLIILLQFNHQTILLGFAAMVLVVIYPLMKRITYYPQLFLGITFNLGILFASTAVLGKITLSHFLLYSACIIWTMIYDTIYGYQDLDDDLKIGIKSAAIKFGANPQKIFFTLIIIFLILLVVVGLVANLKFAYFPFILLAAAHLSCQIKSCDFSNHQDCLKNFKSNSWVGLMILTAILFG